MFAHLKLRVLSLVQTMIGFGNREVAWSACTLFITGYVFATESLFTQLTILGSTKDKAACWSLRLFWGKRFEVIQNFAAFYSSFLSNCFSAIYKSPISLNCYRSFKQDWHYWYLWPYWQPDHLHIAHMYYISCFRIKGRYQVETLTKKRIDKKKKEPSEVKKENYYILLLWSFNG